MVRIEVTTDKWDGGWSGMVFDDAVLNETTGWWDTPNAIFFPYEVRVLGKHEGGYDPNHWGELDPDAYDRMGYGPYDPYTNGHGRHLLHTGTE